MMEGSFTEYEEAKKVVRLRRRREEEGQLELDQFDGDLVGPSPARPIELRDVAQVGTKVVIGAGVGALAGVATIAVVASAAEIVVAGVITKIAGLVGGAAGLSLGINKMRSDRQKRS